MTAKEFQDFLKMVAQNKIKELDTENKTEWAEGYVDAWKIVERLCNETYVTEN